MEKQKTEESKQTMKNSVSRAVFAAVGILLQAGWILLLATKLYHYSTFISTVIGLAAFVLAMRIAGETMNSAYRISWIILILAFPILGVCLYLLFGRGNSIRLMRHHFTDIDRRLVQTLRPDPEILRTLQEENRQLGNQAFYLQEGCGFPVYNDTEVTFYGDTAEALEAQKEELRKARRFIFMEYHAIEDSVAWRGIEEILAERAAAGVDVRVFYDDMGSIGFLSKPFVKRLESRGIACRVFNPLIPVLNVFMNNRDHRKITVVDGRVGFTGGYNLADEYFNLTHPYGQWKDSGLKLTGSAVHSLTVIFLQMWSATQKTMEDPAPFLSGQPHGTAEPAKRGYVLPYADSPLDGENVGENVYLNLIKSAEQYVYITTPYLIIDDEMQKELTLAAKRGVDVRIVTPGIPDKKLVFRITRSYYARLAGSGVRIYEYTPGFLHQKQFLVDDEAAACGTINMDFRSLYLHFENGCWFCHNDAVRQMRMDFESLFTVSEEVTGRYSQERKLSLRGIDCLLRLFSPLL